MESREDARRYLEGADYPASKYDLMSAARNKDASEGFIRRLLGLSSAEFFQPRGGSGGAGPPEGAWTASAVRRLTRDHIFAALEKQ